VAALFRLENSRDAAAIQRILRHLTDWLHAPQQAGLRRSFTEWLRRVLLPGRLPGITIPAMQELQEVDDMLAERVQEWYAEYERKGLLAGMAQGRSDEARRILLGLLTHRFGPVSPEVEAQLQEADVATLEAWTLRVLDATCPEDLFQD